MRFVPELVYHFKSLLARVSRLLNRIWQGSFPWEWGKWKQNRSIVHSQNIFSFKRTLLFLLVEVTMELDEDKRRIRKIPGNKKWESYKKPCQAWIISWAHFQFIGLAMLPLRPPAVIIFKFLWLCAHTKQRLGRSVLGLFSLL